ncbi:hypothetical protein ACWNX2_00590 [Candidatus Vidania fulgoroideorum]
MFFIFTRITKLGVFRSSAANSCFLVSKYFFRERIAVLFLLGFVTIIKCLCLLRIFLVLLS